MHFGHLLSDAMIVMISQVNHPQDLATDREI